MRNQVSPTETCCRQHQAPVPVVQAAGASRLPEQRLVTPRAQGPSSTIVPCRKARTTRRERIHPACASTTAAATPPATSSTHARPAQRAAAVAGTASSFEVPVGNGNSSSGATSQTLAMQCHWHPSELLSGPWPTLQCPDVSWHPTVAMLEAWRPLPRPVVDLEHPWGWGAWLHGPN